MRYLTFVLIGIVILGGVWLLSRAKQPMGEQQAAPTATIKGHILELEIARTPEEQARGLSGRESLAENAGMLFVYEQLAIPGFWMPDMRFSIDIIWIDENRKIVGISENIAPETFPQTFSPPVPVQYVLEVNVNWAKTHNVSVGNEIMLNLNE